MVAPVFRILLLLGVLLPESGMAAPSVFGVEIRQTHIEYGKPLRVTLRTALAQPGLESIDFSILDRDFVVDMPAEVMEDSRTGGQYWRIRLYPRRPGTLLMPTLEFQGSRSAPTRVEVQPARDAEKGSEIRVGSTLPQPQAWVNQPVKVMLYIETEDTFVQLEAEAPWHEDAGTETLPQKKSTIAGDGFSYTRYELGWVITPLKPGQVSLQLPPVKYQRDGVTTHRFYPPRMVLQVRALPSFIPPTLPVGKQTLAATLPDGWFLMQGQLYFLSLGIQEEGGMNRRPVEILQQFKSSPEISYFRPRRLSGGLYQIPFKAEMPGLLSLPDIRLQYFDPATGKIRTRMQPMGSVWVINTWISYGVILGLLVLVLWAARRGYCWTGRQYRVHRQYRKALKAFRQAGDAPALKAGLMEIARAESWPLSLTLKEWQHKWMRRYPHFSEAEEILSRLQQQLYGKQEADLAGMRQQLIRLCHRRLPLLRLLAAFKIG
jgi:hypothetical protein